MKKSKLLLSLLIIPFLFGCTEKKNDTTPNKPIEPDTHNPNPDEGNTTDKPVEPNPDEGEDKPNPDNPENNISNVCILSLNDSHGDFLRDPDSDANGYDAVSTLITKTSKIEENKDPIFICQGDMFQGQFISNTTRGAAVVDALNYLNLEGFVIGNHEFDWGLEEIHRFKDGNLENGELNCPFLGANIIQKSINKRPDWIEPYTILERHGHKIGYIGFMGEGLESSIASDKVKDYKFDPILPLYTKYSAELVEEKKCDTIIVGIHGLEDTYLELAKQKYPARAIFAGHKHIKDLQVVPLGGNINVPMITGACNNEMLTQVNFTYEDNNLTNITTHFIETNTVKSAELDFTLKEKLEEKYADVIRHGNEVLSNNFTHMSRNKWRYFVAKCFVGKFSDGANYGIINKAGIRYGSDYSTTNVLYYKQLFRILPFDNIIYQVKIDKTILDNLSNSNRYLVYEKGLNQTNDSFYILNVIDFVFTGAFDRDVWDKAEVIKTLKLNYRDITAKTIKEG